MISGLFACINTIKLHSPFIVSLDAFTFACTFASHDMTNEFPVDRCTTLSDLSSCIRVTSFKKKGWVYSTAECARERDANFQFCA